MQELDDEWNISRKESIFGFIKDWGIAILLTGLGFFLLS